MLQRQSVCLGSPWRSSAHESGGERRIDWPLPGCSNRIQNRPRRQPMRSRTAAAWSPDQLQGGIRVRSSHPFKRVAGSDRSAFRRSYRRIVKCAGVSRGQSVVSRLLAFREWWRLCPIRSDKSATRCGAGPVCRSSVAHQAGKTQVMQIESSVVKCAARQRLASLGQGEVHGQTNFGFMPW